MTDLSPGAMAHRQLVRSIWSANPDGRSSKSANPQFQPTIPRACTGEFCWETAPSNIEGFS